MPSELNVHFSTINRLRQFCSLVHHNYRACVTTPAQDFHIQHLQPSLCTTEEFLHKLSETVSGKLICMLVINMTNVHIRCRLALWRGVLFTDGSWSSLYRADGRQHVWRRVGERFADVNVDPGWRWGYGTGRCALWRTNTGTFIEGLLNAQRYRDDILRLVVVPFIHDHHLKLQHVNARPRVARICIC